MSGGLRSGELADAAGVKGGIAKLATGGQQKARADHVTVQLGDLHDRRLFERVEERLNAAGPEPAFVALTQLADGADVETTAEVLTGALEEQHPCVGLVRASRDHLVQLVHHRQADRVTRLRPIERDVDDAGALLNNERLELLHATSP